LRRSGCNAHAHDIRRFFDICHAPEIFLKLTKMQ
jgi:hypothetical protein